MYNTAAQIWIDTPYKIEDRNGNEITGVTDTLQRTIASGLNIGGVTYRNPTPPTGAPTSAAVNYQVVHQDTYSSSYNEVIQCPWATGDFVGQITGSQPAWTGIGLPDGTQYTFFYGNYNPNDSTILNNFGLLNEVIFRGGGWIKYTWNIETNLSNATSMETYAGTGLTSGLIRKGACFLQYSVPTLASRSVSYDGVHVAQTQTFSYTTTWPANWLSNPGGWTSRTTTVMTTDNILGNSFKTVYTYNPGGLEKTIQYYDWGNSSTPLKTVYKAWWSQSEELCELTTINGLTSGHFYQYMTQTNPPSGPYPSDYVTDDQEFDYGVISNPSVCGSQNNAGIAPTREIKTTYKGIQVPTSLVPNSQSGQNGAMFYKPTSVVTSDNAGKSLAETDYAYDASSLVSASAVQHDDTNYGTGTTTRGNLTSITRNCLGFSGCTNPVVKYTYDTTGQVTLKVDACGNSTCSDMPSVSGSTHKTQYFYADSGTNMPGGAGSNAYLTKVIYPQTGSVVHKQTFAYNYAYGDLTSSVDENGQTTSYQYECPTPSGCSGGVQGKLDRLIETDFPDGGKTTITYNGASSVVTTQLINSNVSKTTTTAMDGMFHVVQTQLSDDDGTDYTDTTYDGLGRVWKVSNPHRSTGWSTDGTTQTDADVLGRPTTITRQDLSKVQVNYGTACLLTANALGVTTIDEAGHPRQTCTNGMSQLLEVDEPTVTPTPATAATGVFSITGSEQGPVQAPNCPPGAQCPVYDSGQLTVTVNGQTVGAGFGQGSTAASILSYLTSAIDSNPNMQVSSDSAGNLTAKTVGSITNYPFSVSMSHNSTLFPNPSFTITGSGPYLTGGTDEVSASNSYITLYKYNLLNDLTCVEQHGSATNQTGCSSAPSNDPTSAWRIRRFSYDPLSRLLTATNPEIGFNQISYAYDVNGNLASKVAPSPNQAQGGTATVTTNYSYDTLNRLTAKSYVDTYAPPNPTTPAASYSYDAFVAGSNNGIGHRTGMTDGSGSSTWTYDTMGRVWSETHTISGFTKTISNLYWLDGSIQQITYPSGTVLSYTPNMASHVTKVADATRTYMSNAHYAPAGQLDQATFGAVNQTSIFNSRLQPCWLYMNTGSILSPTNPCNGQTSPPGNVMDLTYDFRIGGGDNGNLMNITNNNTSYRSVAFTYDDLNRITSANTPATDCTVIPGTSLTKNWGEIVTVDAWGNLTGRTVTKCQADGLSVTPNNNNQLVSFGYDAAGNMISNSGAAYSYDAENRLISAGGVAYTYDGDSNRVEKSSGTLYWGAGPMLESDCNGNLQREYVFVNGRRITRRDLSPNSNPDYFFTDHLDSTHVVADNTGAILNDSDYFPYGGERIIKLALSNQNYKLAGKERDAETNLDYFAARFDSSNLSRFMSPDPVGGHQEDPQTLNRYAYVRNSPTTLTDPTGLDSYLECADGQDGCQQRAVGIDEHNQVKWANVQTEKVDGKTVAIEVKSDNKGNLYDRNSGQSYTGSANGSGMFFSKDGGKTSSAGVFDNFSGHEDTFQDAGWANGGKLSGGFQYTLTNSKLEANQTEAGFFTFPGNPAQTGLSLQLAGFDYHQFGLDLGSDEYRSPGAPGTGANSAHFVVNYWQINPTFGVPTFGQMHFGETNPSNFFQHVKEWWQ